MSERIGTGAPREMGGPATYPTASPMSGDDTRSTAESVKREAAEVGTRIRDEAAGAAEDIKAEGAEVARVAKEKAGEFVESQQQKGAEQVQTTADAVHGAADELEQASPVAAKYVHEAATALNNLGQKLRDSSPRDLLADVEALARRQPVAFFGAAVLAGFALTRFAKSSAASSRPYAASENGYRGSAGMPNGVGDPMSGNGTGNLRAGTLAAGTHGTPTPGIPRPMQRNEMGGS